MSDPVIAAAPGQARPAGDTGPGTDAGRLFPVARSWKVAAVMAGIMVALAMVGVAITTASQAAAPIYWISLVPLYGALCLATAWSRARHAGAAERRPLILRQVWHWLGIGVALSLDFVVRGTGEESGRAAGLNALLLLALGCYLAGVHLEWIFTLVGGLLVLTLIVLAQAEEYFWLIFVAGGVSIAALYWLHRMFEGRRRAKGVAVTPAR